MAFTVIQLIFLGLSLTGDQSLGERTSVRWADRLSGKCDAGNFMFRFNCLDAAEAYEGILSKYPRSKRAQLGLARCRVGLGEYKGAVSAYRSAGNLASGAELADARAKLALKLVLDKKLARPIQTLQLEHVANHKGLWYALVCEQHGGWDSNHQYEPPWKNHLRVEVVREGTSDVEVLDEVQLKDASDELPREASIKSVLLDGTNRQAVLFLRMYSSGDSDPNKLEALEWKGKRLRSVGYFFSHGGIKTFAGRDGRLVVADAATWKVSWTDYYEWSSGAFRFANQRHVATNESYDEPDYYPATLRLAAIEANRGHFVKAAKFLRLARDQCKKAIAYERGNLKYERFRSYAFNGLSSEESLKQINRRLRWIHAGDYNHWLLYRPYDLDLQVPPYRLGNAYPTFSTDF